MDLSGGGHDPMKKSLSEQVVYLRYCRRQHVIYTGLNVWKHAFADPEARKKMTGMCCVEFLN